MLLDILDDCYYCFRMISLMFCCFIDLLGLSVVGLDCLLWFRFWFGFLWLIGGVWWVFWVVWFRLCVYYVFDILFNGDALCWLFCDCWFWVEELTLVLLDTCLAGWCWFGCFPGFLFIMIDCCYFRCFGCRLLLRFLLITLCVGYLFWFVFAYVWFKHFV